MTSRVVCIVQARMASTRLPGKILERLAGETVLSHVLRRCAVIKGCDVVCCAIPDSEECSVIAEEAQRYGALVFRGSETDVLDRYHGAAKACGADIVIRVTSDCPLIDPGVCAKVLDHMQNEKADYACNNMPPSWPHGLDCEVFSMEALARANEEATAPDEREHVTPWIRTHPDMRRVNLPADQEGLAEMRWTLDYPEDLKFFRALFKLLPGSPGIVGYEEIVVLLRANPDITAINADCYQRRCA